jgi:hypothetical protein
VGLVERQPRQGGTYIPRTIEAALGHLAVRKIDARTLENFYAEPSPAIRVRPSHGTRTLRSPHRIPVVSQADNLRIRRPAASTLRGRSQLEFWLAPQAEHPMTVPWT